MSTPRRPDPDKAPEARKKAAGAAKARRRSAPSKSRAPGSTELARAWLQARGLRAGLPEMQGMLAVALEELPAELQLDTREELSAPELAALVRGGLDTRARTAASDPLAQGAAEYAALLETALDVHAAAERSGVGPTRIRQRLNSTPRTLVGVRVGNVWRVPLFQFDEASGKLLPGLERVVPAIDPDVHVLAIQRWFLHENADLFADDEERDRVSPRDWLRLGRSSERLVELAREL